VDCAKLPATLSIPESPLINIVLRPHQDEKHVARLKKPHIRTSKDVTVHAMKAFLGRKLSYVPFHDFQLLVSIDRTLVILDDTITLAIVKSEIADPPETGDYIEIQYRIGPGRMTLQED